MIVFVQLGQAHFGTSALLSILLDNSASDVRFVSDVLVV